MYNRLCYYYKFNHIKHPYIVSSNGKCNKNTSTCSTNGCEVSVDTAVSMTTSESCVETVFVDRVALMRICCKSTRTESRSLRVTGRADSPTESELQSDSRKGTVND